MAREGGLPLLLLLLGSQWAGWGATRREACPPARAPSRTTPHSHPHPPPAHLARAQIRATPRFLFLVDGALVGTASIADSRRMAAASRSAVRTHLLTEHQRLRDTLWQLLVRNAPSARR